MVLSTEDKMLIKALRQKTGDGARKLTVEFPNKAWTLCGLSYHIRKISSTAQWSGGKVQQYLFAIIERSDRRQMTR